MDYRDWVGIPPAGTFNQGLSSPGAKFLRTLLGEPRSSYTYSCQSVELAPLQALMQTRSFGAFSATGVSPAIESLATLMERVQAELPDLFALTRTSGMLCCRKVKLKTPKPTDPPSNHSWGVAIDLYIEPHPGEETESPGDDRAQRGLLVLSSYFNAAKWYWGAAFPREDAMHFEVSRELLKSWRAAGRI